MKKIKIKNWPDKFKNHERQLVELDLSRVAGLYFLLNRGEIVYIGNSTNVYQRISYHYSKADFIFANAMILFMSDKQICDIMEIQIINIVKPKYNIQHIKKTEKKQKKSNKKPPLSKIMNEVIGTIEKEKIGGVMKDEKDEKLVGYDTVKVACNCAEESKGMRAREVCKHWICPAHGYKHI